MTNYQQHSTEIERAGFTILPDIYTQTEVTAILAEIQAANTSGDTFRKTDDLFAIRQCVKEIPGLLKLVYNEQLSRLITQLFGSGYFITKSIYFDKPSKSNWFVAWHQDLTISVNRKEQIEGFGPWTVKQNQFAVQPPLSILGNNFTIRIHLDNTTAENGALKVVPGSHAKGIYRPESIDWAIEKEETCEVPQGGVMIMKPLLLHASGRTTNQQQRRVLHIEFGKDKLPAPLEWSEYGPRANDRLFEKTENHVSEPEAVSAGKPVWQTGVLQPARQTKQHL